MKLVASLHHVSKSFKSSVPLGFARQRHLVLKGIDLEIPERMTTALVGESGSGKTTLARCLIRLHEIDSGRIELAGQDITHLSGGALRDVRRHMQMIFQDPYSALNPRLTVQEILREPLQAFKLGNLAEQEERVIAALAHVGLDSTARQRFPHEFSGGQRQRLVIARALMSRPSLVIADEPVSALDVSVQSQILNLLKDLQQELAMAYLFISHNLAVVQHMAHFVVILYQGLIVEQGTVEALFARPQHPYTHSLLKAAPRFASHASPDEAWEDAAATMQAATTGCPFRLRCPKATAICTERVPSLQKRSEDDSHLVACHHAGPA